MVASKESLDVLLGNNGISNTDTIVVYDDGNNLRAGRMFWILKYYGHEDVRLLSGGKMAWKRQGLDLDQKQPTFDKTDYQIENINSEYRTILDNVWGSLDNDDIVIVDVRSPEEYVGEVGGCHSR
jgi:thiosulfate/3-mercaptopyruvate sulfurtransferase